MSDFGWSGDEVFLHQCQDDYRMDLLDARADEWEEHQQVLEELAREEAGDDDFDEYHHWLEEDDVLCPMCGALLMESVYCSECGKFIG